MYVLIFTLVIVVIAILVVTPVFILKERLIMKYRKKRVNEAIDDYIKKNTSK